MLQSVKSQRLDFQLGANEMKIIKGRWHVEKVCFKYVDFTYTFASKQMLFVSGLRSDRIMLVVNIVLNCNTTK